MYGSHTALDRLMNQTESLFTIIYASFLLTIVWSKYVILFVNFVRPTQGENIALYMAM